MTVMDISMPARIRIFRAVYVRDLDRVAASEVIRLGLMGDLRFGDRYALGVIARRTVDESELASVGRLASALVAEPFGTLRGYFKRTWETSAPQEEFDQIIAATGSSLWFQQISTTRKYLMRPRSYPLIRASTRYAHGARLSYARPYGRNMIGGSMIG